MARPSDYSAQTASEICGRLATGENLVKICRDEHMPNPATVYRWLIAHKEFRDSYARAREDQADTLADEILDISEQTPPMEQTKFGEKVDAGFVQHQRLRVDSRKFIASKLKPKKYGDKVDLTTDGRALTIGLVAYAAELRSDDPVSIQSPSLPAPDIEGSGQRH